MDVTNTDNASHGFQIVVQVSCQSSGFFSTSFNASRKPFICAGGSVTIGLLPAHTSTTVGVDFDVAVEPERTQIDDLSFIVQELQPGPGTTPGPGPCTPDFAITASPTSVNINRTLIPNATIVNTVTSICGFSGNVDFTSTVSGPGSLSVTYFPSTVLLTGSATTLEIVNVSPSTASGTYTVVTIASTTTLAHLATVIVIVF